MIYVKSIHTVRCKNTRSSSLAHTRAHTPLRGGTGPIGKTRSGRVIYCGFRTGDPRWTQRCLLGPEDILSETHTACTPERNARPVYTYILAVSLIPAGDKATSSIWYVCKNKSNTANLGIFLLPSPSPGRLVSRDKRRIDLVAPSIYIGTPRVGRGREKFANTRADWTPLSVPARKHAGDDRETT